MGEDDGRIMIDERSNNGVGGYMGYKKGEIMGIIGNWEGE